MSANAVVFGYSVMMREMTCGMCGVCFAAPETMMAEKQRTGDGFYCPNGHARVYRETDVEKLKKQLTAEQNRSTEANRKRREAEEAKTKAERKLKRTERRIARGVCPCCKRHFVNVERHMKSKHPEEATA